MAENSICPLCRSARLKEVYKPQIASGSEISFSYTFSPAHSRTFGVVRCLDCTHVFCAPIPDDVSAHYVDVVDHEYLKHALSRKLTASSLVKVLQRYRPGGKLLDIGSATGDFLDVAEKEGNYIVEGLEPCVWSSEVARKRGLTVHREFLEDFSKEHKEQYDAVTLWGVIEHIADPVAQVGRIKTLLRTGGIVALWTGDVDSVTSHFLGRKWWYWQGQHIQYFTHSSLLRLFRVQGFEHLTTGRYPFAASFETISNSLSRYRSQKIFTTLLKPLFAVKPVFFLRLPGEMLFIARKS